APRAGRDDSPKTTDRPRARPCEADLKHARPATSACRHACSGQIGMAQERDYRITQRQMERSGARCIICRSIHRPPWHQGPQLLSAIPASSLDELNEFLTSVERRAFKRTAFAVRDDDAALDIVQDAMIRLCTSYAEKPSN